DALYAALQWRKRARDALHSPDPVELAHVSRVPQGARTKRSLPTHGGSARQGAAREQRLAVRAEVGRLPRRARERRRRGRPLVAERPAAASLLPGAAPARREAAAPLRSRRRDRDRPSRRARLRFDADAAA